MKTAGVVVTYNRKEELVKNIRAILSQSYVVDRYYIIDNHSSDNTEQLLKEEGKTFLYGMWILEATFTF